MCHANAACVREGGKSAEVTIAKSVQSQCMSPSTRSKGTMHVHARKSGMVQKCRKSFCHPVLLFSCSLLAGNKLNFKQRAGNKNVSSCQTVWNIARVVVHACAAQRAGVCPRQVATTGQIMSRDPMTIPSVRPVQPEAAVQCKVQSAKYSAIQYSENSKTKPQCGDPKQ